MRWRWPRPRWASFCTIVLVTGPIWARPVWGIWWTWDARLTSTLVLWLIYVSYLVLRHYATGGQIPVLAAALGIFGFVDVPIVYMAIRWFRTQHPQPVIGGGEGSGLAPAMWVAVLWNLAAFAMLALSSCWIRYRQALPSTHWKRRTRRHRLKRRTHNERRNHNVYLYAAYIVVWVVHLRLCLHPCQPRQAHEARSRELTRQLATSFRARCFLYHCWIC